MSKQKSTSERGHATNLASIKAMRTKLASFENRYNPANTEITWSSINSLCTAATTAAETLTEVEGPLIAAKAKRKVAFAKAKPYATRIVNLLASTQDVLPSVLENARAANRKIQGTSLTESRRNATLKANKARGIEPAPEDTGDGISTSQRSFVFVIKHYQDLVALLDVTPYYLPNEADCTIDAIKTYIQLMDDTNTEVKDAEQPYDRAKNLRDKIFYDEETGLVKISKKVKAYAKGALGATTPEYKQLNSIPFFTIKE